MNISSIKLLNAQVLQVLWVFVQVLWQVLSEFYKFCGFVWVQQYVVEVVVSSSRRDRLAVLGAVGSSFRARSRTAGTARNFRQTRDHGTDRKRQEQTQTGTDTNRNRQEQTQTDRNRHNRQTDTRGRTDKSENIENTSASYTSISLCRSINAVGTRAEPATELRKKS